MLKMLQDVEVKVPSEKFFLDLFCSGFLEFLLAQLSFVSNVGAAPSFSFPLHSILILCLFGLTIAPKEHKCSYF